MNLPAIAIKIVVWLVVRAIRAWGSHVDWDEIKKDAIEIVCRVLPGDCWDDEGAAVIGCVVDLLRELLTEEGRMCVCTEDQIEALADEAMRRLKMP